MIDTYYAVGGEHLAISHSEELTRDPFSSRTVRLCLIYAIYTRQLKRLKKYFKPTCYQRDTNTRSIIDVASKYHKM